MKLYGYFRSSASYRVRIALNLKAIEYEHVPVHLVKDGGQQKAPEFSKLNPLQQVPVLEFQRDERVVRLSQSVAILEYLEESYPEPALMPEDPVMRAQVRRAVEIVNSGVQPLQNLSLLDHLKELGGDPQAFAKAANEKGLAALEALTSEVGGSFLVAGGLSLADVCFVPQMFSARRFGVDLAPFPRLRDLDARLSEIPAVAAAHPDRQPDAAN